MVEIVEVKTKKQLKDFVWFPIKMYKDCPYYVPNLVGEEMKLINPKKNFNLEKNEIKCFLAYKDGILAGRIAGILQNEYNAKTGFKRMRFSRFDLIDDFEVCKALLGAVENYAREKGMDSVHGPLGFNDLEREGLLVDGFDKRSTFASAYNYEYYHTYLKMLGYEKEAEWHEFSINVSEKPDERIERISNYVLKKHKLTDIAPTVKNKDIVKKYGHEFFEVINTAYASLHGVVPITDKVLKNVLGQFGLLVDKRFVCMLKNEEGKIIGVGLLFASIAEAVKKSNGKLFPLGALRILRAIKKPKEVELALIAVLPEYQNKGINAVIINTVTANVYKVGGVLRAETNLQLVENTDVQSQWETMDTKLIKRRYCLIKYI